MHNNEDVEEDWDYETGGTAPRGKGESEKGPRRERIQTFLAFPAFLAYLARRTLCFMSVIIFVFFSAKDYPVAAHSSFLTADSRSN